MFHGSIVALVTPMKLNGEIDLKSLHDLIEWHIEQGTDGIVISGSTGEAATLNAQDRHTLFKTVVDQVDERIPVIAGTGTYSTRDTIEQSKLAMELGVDACLLVTPYYNRPTQEGLYQHFRAVADAVPLPLILYNVPSRTGCDMLPETVERLDHVSNIIGLKEATGKLERVTEIHQRCKEGLDLFSGDDLTSLDFMLLGGKGVISVTANVAPNLMHKMCEAALKGDRATALMYDQKLAGLHQHLFIESNPIPVKWALQQMGKIPGGIRLPLLPLSQTHHAKVREAMQQAGLP